MCDVWHRGVYDAWCTCNCTVYSVRCSELYRVHHALHKPNETKWNERRISWICFRFESLSWNAFWCVNFANESWVRDHFEFFNDSAIRDDKAFHWTACAMCLSLSLSINHYHSSGVRLSVDWFSICLCILHAIQIFWMYSIN